MKYFRKNKLITFIILAMLAGLLTGYIVNRSIKSDRFKYNIDALTVKDPVAKQEIVKAISSYEEHIFRERKKGGGVALFNS